MPHLSLSPSRMGSAGWFLYCHFIAFICELGALLYATLEPGKLAQNHEMVSCFFGHSKSLC